MPQKRSRDGCWTCRKRKKKCDSSTSPCSTCTRLGLKCERETRLVWEDDARRDGMSRRGPSKSSKQSKPPKPPDPVETILDPKTTSAPASPTLEMRGPSCWPFEFQKTDSSLLDRYIGLFSRTYPAFSGPSNPFLTILLPLSMQCRSVLDSLLALAAVQTWSNGSFAMEADMLRLRQKALRGSRKLLISYSQGQEDVLNVLATCVLLLLYEKLVGEGQNNWTPHLAFSARIIPSRFFPIVSKPPRKEACRFPRNETFRFLASLFFYNDLVRSTSMRTPTLSNFYHGHDPRFSQCDGQFYFPHLIARLSIGDLTVTEPNIATWDGRLEWIPSFALNPPQSTSGATNSCEPAEWDENDIVAELYRKAAFIYRRQCFQQYFSDDSGPGLDSLTYEMTNEDLAVCAIQLLEFLPQGSAFETSLLWPIGIIAPELTASHEAERQHLLSKLQSLEERFQMRHYGKVAQYLTNLWSTGRQIKEDEYILFG